MENVNKEQKLNATDEQLLISAVMSSFLTKLQSRLKELENEKTWDEWDDGFSSGRKDMIEEVMKMVEELSKNYS
jgi:L-lactate utilization protein LutB